MVQLAYLVYDNNGNKISGGDYIIKPVGFTIPADASKIHGITTEKATNEGKDLLAVLQEFEILARKADYIVAHNMSFDEKITGAEFLRNNMINCFTGKTKICTKESSTDYCKLPGNYGYKWPTLKELHIKLFNTGFEDAHNAAVDIEATAKCFWELVSIKEIILNNVSIKPKLYKTDKTHLKIGEENPVVKIPFPIAVVREPYPITELKQPIKPNKPEIKIVSSPTRPKREAGSGSAIGFIIASLALSLLSWWGYSTFKSDNGEMALIAIFFTIMTIGLIIVKSSFENSRSNDYEKAKNKYHKDLGQLPFLNKKAQDEYKNDLIKWELECKHYDDDSKKYNEYLTVKKQQTVPLIASKVESKLTNATNLAARKEAQLAWVKKQLDDTKDMVIVVPVFEELKVPVFHPFIVSTEKVWVPTNQVIRQGNNPAWGAVLLYGKDTTIGEESDTSLLSCMIPVSEKNFNKYTAGQLLPGRIDIEYSTRAPNPKNLDQDQYFINEDARKLNLPACDADGNIIYAVSYWENELDQTKPATIEIANMNEILGITSGIYSRVCGFREGLAPVCKNDKWGFINKTGKEIVSCNYDKVLPFDKGFAQVIKSQKSKQKYNQDAYGVEFYYQSGKRTGFIDKLGNEIVACNYVYIGEFIEGLAIAVYNYKMGFVNHSGKEIVPFEYDCVNEFSEGLACVMKWKENSNKELWGYINMNGVVVIPLIYEHAESFVEGEGEATVYPNAYECFIIDKKGKILRETRGTWGGSIPF